MIHDISDNPPASRPSALSFAPWASLPAILIVLDQLIKLLIVAWIGPDASRHRVDVVGDALGFEYVENTGAAFGIMTSATGALAAVSLLIAAGGLFMLWREHREHPIAALAIALVVGGALGNVIDRIFLGYVVDFVALGGFPRFNLADSAISIGVLMLIVSMICDERQPPRTPERTGPQDE